MKHEFKVIPKEEVLDNRSNAYEFIDFDKQETLEETAENYKINIIKSGRSHRVEYTQQIKLDFIAGAKWQQEQYKKIFIQLVDLLEELKPIYREDSYSYKHYQLERLEIIKQLKNK